MQIASSVTSCATLLSFGLRISECLCTVSSQFTSQEVTHPGFTLHFLINIPGIYKGGVANLVIKHGKLDILTGDPKLNESVYGKIIRNFMGFFSYIARFDYQRV